MNLLQCARNIFGKIGAQTVKLQANGAFEAGGEKILSA
jgi:hypothetical protein